ncbi:MAG: thiamine pyrophosphate-dependent enzyme [Pseudomonadota bacterium]
MPGHRACIGCGEVLAMRQIMKSLGKDTVVCMATGCMEIISSPFPTTNWMTPWVHTLFENAAAVAAGVESGFEIMKRKGRGPAQEVTVVAMGGDGATFDIGLQALSGALERGHNFIYVCLDNEGYMNTGIQRTSATPYGATTTTSPHGKNSIGQTTEKKDMPLIALAHHIPYVATASPSYPTDLARKVKKAKEIKGPAFLHVFSTCPTGWGTNPELAIELGRLAVETGLFPLGEVVYGKYELTKYMKQLRPIRDYFKHQRRFRHLSDDIIDQIQDRVKKHYEVVKQKCGMVQ